MRGIPSLITDIRKNVFTEVARMAYAGNGVEAANELLKIEKHFEPREEVAAAYDKLYECFSELFPVLRTMFEKLNG